MNRDDTHALVLSDEFKVQVEELKKDMRRKYKAISEETTPQVDGSGRKIIDQRDGLDYIIEAYMREKLDEKFPGWSWEGMPIVPMGAEWLLAQGHLIIIDTDLLAFGIFPPVRKFHGVGAGRVQYKTCKCRRGNNNIPVPDCKVCHGTGNMPHTPENVVDIDKNIKAANSAALKYAINRLCHIGDDVYGKRIEEEGMGTYEDILEASGSATAFGKLVSQHGLKFSEVYDILSKAYGRSIKNASDIEDYTEAWQKIKEAKGIK